MNVTLIGLGPMGQAMVRALLREGHTVTVWNRTASRADKVVAEGATRAPSAAAAVAASELVILSLTDYQAMYDILEPLSSSLAGRVVVNLSSDTPEASRAAATWLNARGAQLLVGGVMAPENVVATEAAYVFYSGPREVFDAHSATLAVIGRPDYRGEDPGLAQLFYQAQLDIFLTSLSAYLHATALIGSAGVSAAEFAPYAAETFSGIAEYLPGAAADVDSRTYPGDGGNATMMGATAAHIVGASRAAGVELGLPSAVLAHYERAIAAGHGKDSWTSLIEGIRNPAS